MRRDFLPSQVGDTVTRALDESYERGFMMGRRAGLSAAADILRGLKDYPPSLQVANLITLFERMKYDA